MQKIKFGVNTGVLVMSVLILGAAVAVSAESRLGVDVTASTSVKVRGATVKSEMKAEAKAGAEAKRIEKAKTKANQEIDRRIEAIEKLSARIKEMKKIGDSEKANLSATLTTEIANLTSLRTKIAADVDLETVKNDVKNITQSYRIFALVIPQWNIVAAADRVLYTADMLTSLGGKLKIRIDEAKASGKDVTALLTSLADLMSKTAEAKVDANAAVTLAASLTPDGGDEAKFQANKKALVEARSKVKAGSEALRAARHDADVIARALKSMSMKIRTTATTTISI